MTTAAECWCISILMANGRFDKDFRAKWAEKTRHGGCMRYIIKGYEILSILE